MSKKIHVATIKTAELKVRKKSARPTRLHRSEKAYNRKKLKASDRSKLDGEA